MLNASGRWAVSGLDGVGGVGVRRFVWSCGFFFLTWAVFPGRSLAQAGGDIDAAKDERIRFLSLEAFDRREKLLRIRERFLEDRNIRERYVVDAEGLFVGFRRISQIKDGDERILACMDLGRSVLELLDTLSDASKRTNGTLEAIDDAAGDELGVSSSAVQYLSEVRKQVRRMAAEQSSLRERLRALGGALKKAIRDVPAPARFENDRGISMVLIGSGKGAFYVSEGPVSRGCFGAFAEVLPTGASWRESFGSGGEPAAPATGIPWQACRLFCRWLSDEEQGLYRLPGMAEVKTLSRVSRPPVAVWTGARWRPANADRRAMLSRFGVTMMSIWDPVGVLGGGPVFGELPFATYWDLGFLIVTSQETGRIARWNRLKSMRERGN